MRQEVSTQARQILGDVVEDFATVEGVMERFEQWKEEDGASYNDAYVSLCLPKVTFVKTKINTCVLLAKKEVKHKESHSQSATQKCTYIADATASDDT